MPYVCIEDSRLFYHFYYIPIDHDCEIHVKFTWTYHDFVVTWLFSMNVARFHVAQLLRERPCNPGWKSRVYMTIYII